LLVLVPLYISVTGGAKTMGQLLSQPLNLPAPLVITQYSNILVGKVGSFWRALGNSALVAGLSVVIELFVCAGAAFALARLRFRLNNVIYNYFLLGLLFPLAVAILPLYLQVRRLGLLDRYWGVVLPQVAFQIPFQVLLLRGFFRAIPHELEDATEIDGYGPLGFLWFMVVPLSTPILATSGVLTLVASWNNFFLPLLVFNSNSHFTLPMGVMDFMGEYMTGWNLILGYLTLAMIPAVLLFIFAQKYIVAGLTGGAIKG
jgi:raffinose/stachyose/melibiose transport system permease protein